MSPSGDAIGRTAGSLICSYPRLAFETPNEVFDDPDFQLEFAIFLSRPGAVDSDLPPPPPTASAMDYYTSDIPRITNGVRGHISWSRSRIEPPISGTLSLVCRMIPLPMVSGVTRYFGFSIMIRVAVQMSLLIDLLSDVLPIKDSRCSSYALAGDADNARLSSDLLHLMSSKILRRLSKLGSSTPDWLSEVALKTCTCLRMILDDRRRLSSTLPSPSRHPS